MLWRNKASDVSASVGLRDAVIGLTFEWELTDKQGLDLEGEGTTGAKGQGRNKQGPSVAGAPWLSGRKVAEVSVGRRAETGSLRALGEVELYLTEMENNYRLLSLPFSHSPYFQLFMWHLFFNDYILGQMWASLISHNINKIKSLSFLTMT